tara:strand:- start:660 stop:1334 length:675 start_codon:yes stop_codon:yes gene_type:complete
MKKLEHDGTCKEVHPKMSHEEWEEDQENLITGEEEELEELVDYDGAVMGSKVPLGWENVKTMSATKTMDATINMGRQSGEQGRGYFFKRYWGESVEELGEHDMTDVLGYDDTVYMDAGETIEYFKKEHDMEEDEAEDRAESMGKTKSLDNKSDDGESFQRLVEDDDIIKMLEVILKNKDEDSGVQNNEDREIPHYIDNKLRLIQKYARNHGVDMKSIINRLKDE